MAALMKLRSLCSLAKKPGSNVIYHVVRTRTKTHFDYMPGPYPKTEEERKKAAEKYGLHPAEYQPYPDDGTEGRGDYPMLPKIGVALRDPFYPYDNPDERRNFGEVIHAEINIMGEDRVDFGEKPPVPYWVAIVGFWGTVGVLATLVLLMEPYPDFEPVMERQVPYNGKTYYTFEPAK